MEKKPQRQYRGRGRKPNKSTAAESRTDNSSQLRPGKDVPDEQPVTESAVQQEAKPTPDKKRYRGIRSGKPKAARPEKKDEVVKKAAHEKPPEEVQKEKKTRDSEAGIVKQKRVSTKKTAPAKVSSASGRGRPVQEVKNDSNAEHTKKISQKPPAKKPEIDIVAVTMENIPDSVSSLPEEGSLRLLLELFEALAKGDKKALKARDIKEMKNAIGNFFKENDLHVFGRVNEVYKEANHDAMLFIRREDVQPNRVLEVRHKGLRKARQTVIKSRVVVSK
jgi:hypothetical protein